MIDPLETVDENALVPEIIERDYRTADVFRRHGIDYCCNAGWTLKNACERKGVDTSSVKQDLEEAMRARHISGALPFSEWPLDFLIDYVVHVHHGYLRQTLPMLKEQIGKFIASHRKELPFADQLQQQFMLLSEQIPSGMQQEEEKIFPYIRSIHRAYKNKESFGGLLTRTLRKPVENVMGQERELINGVLQQLRTVTNNYTPAGNACAIHWVIFLKLRELDNDLVQHVHLENRIILPRVLAIEKELNKS